MAHEQHKILTKWQFNRINRPQIAVLAHEDHHCSEKVRSLGLGLAESLLTKDQGVQTDLMMKNPLDFASHVIFDNSQINCNN